VRLPAATVAALLLACLAFPSAAGCAETHVPAPYEAEEFPGWLKDLRRAEVILVGSFPFTLFFTFETYDTYRFFANGMDPSFSPWPLRPGSAQVYTDDEKKKVLVTAVSLSLLIAVTDYVIGRIHERAAHR
jgi:hypothetical protein